MSMREYGVNDYGLLLTKEVMMVLAAKHCEDFTEEDFEEDEWSFCERVEEIIVKLTISVSLQEKQLVLRMTAL